MAGALIPIGASIAGALAGTAAQYALSGAGGGTVSSSVAREPAMVEAARSAAIKELSPILLQLLRSPESIYQLANIEKLIAPLSLGQQSIVDLAQKIVSQGYMTDIDRMAVQMAGQLLAASPESMLLPSLTNVVREQFLADILTNLERSKREGLGTERYSPSIRRAAKAAQEKARGRLTERTLTIADLLQSSLGVTDVETLIRLLPYYDYLQSQAAEIIRATQGGSGLLAKMASLTPILSIPRQQETAERSALEDIRRNIIETTLGALRIQPAQITSTSKESTIFPWTYSIASGIGSGIGQWLMQLGNRTTSPTFTSPLLGATLPSTFSYSLPQTSNFSLFGTSSSPSFSLGVSLPSWAY